MSDATRQPDAFAEGSQDVTPHLVGRMVDDDLSWEEWRQLLKLPHKDTDRIRKYLEALQQRVGFDDPILLRLSDHLYVVRAPEGRIVKCDCGHAFGDYRVNWKLAALVHVRDTADSIAEVYRKEAFAPEPGWSEVREYYCPGCARQLCVEVVPPGYPPIFEFLPDLDAFYGEWLGEPLADQAQDWFEDRTQQQTAKWAE
ncbi:MAG TPA: acetone carboxylase subunit gamma [Gammaproteobacteria bacterium]|nr:acetone carboxylase subunit gamma [Gammaproteobacteria bacterium]